MKATSLLANAKKDKTSDQKIIVNLLSQQPLKDFTYKEICREVGWWDDPNRASRRMAELVRLNLITEERVRPCFIAKSKCTAYKIKR
jgi:hypothetical protein